jgi:ubiquinone/menaquinone biosynthesis C-methylase UbiE
LEKKLPFQSDYFDLALSFFVLEHIESLEELFTEVYRIMKDDGMWIIGHFIQRKAFTFRKPFQFRIKMFNYRLDEIEKIARGV